MKSVYKDAPVVLGGQETEKATLLQVASSRGTQTLEAGVLQEGDQNGEHRTEEEEKPLDEEEHECGIVEVLSNLSQHDENLSK